MDRYVAVRRVDGKLLYYIVKDGKRIPIAKSKIPPEILESIVIVTAWNPTKKSKTKKSKAPKNYEPENEETRFTIPENKDSKFLRCPVITSMCYTSGETCEEFYNNIFELISRKCDITLADVKCAMIESANIASFINKNGLLKHADDVVNTHDAMTVMQYIRDRAGYSLIDDKLIYMVNVPTSPEHKENVDKPDEEPEYSDNQVDQKDSEDEPSENSDTKNLNYIPDETYAKDFILTTTLMETGAVEIFDMLGYNVQTIELIAQKLDTDKKESVYSYKVHIEGGCNIDRANERIELDGEPIMFDCTM